MTWDYRSVAMLPEGVSQEVQGTFQDISNLGLQGMPMLPEIHLRKSVQEHQELQSPI